MGIHLDHVSLPTGRNHFKQMRDFYVNLLTPFGYFVMVEVPGGFCGLQGNRSPDFWLHRGQEEFAPIDRAAASADDIIEGRGRTHVAFRLTSPKKVDEWYATAMEVGGICNGKPGPRDMVPGYYAAYVLDPLGNNVECFYLDTFTMHLKANARKWFPYALGAVAAGGAAVYARAAGWV